MSRSPPGPGVFQLKRAGGREDKPVDPPHDKRNDREASRCPAPAAIAIVSMALDKLLELI